MVVGGCGKSCDEYAVAALNVDVVDASGAPICDAEVIATNDTDAFVLEAMGCSYVGAWERSGTYVVQVSHAGRITTSESIRVESDGCHPKGVRVDLTVPAQ
jgi:hypothetical protein